MCGNAVSPNSGAEGSLLLCDPLIDCCAVLALGHSVIGTYQVQASIHHQLRCAIITAGCAPLSSSLMMRRLVLDEETPRCSACP